MATPPHWVTSLLTSRYHRFMAMPLRNIDRGNSSPVPSDFYPFLLSVSSLFFLYLFEIIIIIIIIVVIVIVDVNMFSD